MTSIKAGMVEPDRWQQISSLFHAARERPPGERSVFLEASCGGDKSLRREVESLLAAHEKAVGFMESPAFSVQDLTEQEEQIQERLVGSYRIERVLGRGGMGVVYLAEDLKLGRKVAIKALPVPFTLDEQRRERLRQEARAAARLSHPGIATVYALEEKGDGLYIVFEYVDGPTLRAELDGGALPLTSLVETALQIARALAVAHGAGIVHRDLKPENLIRCRDGTVKILDFGLARFQVPATPLDATSTRLTAAGTMLGTPGYVSPEQIAGGTVDHRTDLFAFGVLIYELGSGIHPFEGSTPASTVARILEVEPTALAKRMPTCPPDLERIVKRCLQKKPADRYQSAGDLTVDLERLQRAVLSGQSLNGEDESAVSAAASRPALAVSWWRFHQFATMGVYALLTYPMWLARKAAAGRTGLVLFIAFVTCAALNGTLRAHLVFAHRLDPTELAGELRRSARWRYWSDCGVALITAAAAAFSVGSNVALGATLAALAVGCYAAFAIIEPATTRSAFRLDS